MEEKKKRTKKRKMKRKPQYSNGGGVLGFDTKTWKWILELEKFLQESPASLGLTDTQIFDNVNARLPREERIGLSTWEALKGDSNCARGINSHKSWTDEQKEFVKDIIRMARSVKSYELMKLSIEKTNKNSIGAHRIAQAMNPQIQTNQLQLGEGNTILNITVGSSEHTEMIKNLVEDRTIDISHEEVNDNRKIENE